MLMDLYLFKMDLEDKVWLNRRKECKMIVILDCKEWFHQNKSFQNQMKLKNKKIVMFRGMLWLRKLEFKKMRNKEMIIENREINLNKIA